MDNFGQSALAVLPDLDWDGYPELLVGAVGDDDTPGGGFANDGAVYVLYLGAGALLRCVEILGVAVEVPRSSTAPTCGATACPSRLHPSPSPMHPSPHPVRAQQVREAERRRARPRARAGRQQLLLRQFGDAAGAAR